MNMRLTDLQVWDAAYRQMDTGELDRCSAEVGRLVAAVSDVELRGELDRAVGEYVAVYFDQAFAAGWKCAKRPESIVFGE